MTNEYGTPLEIDDPFAKDLLCSLICVEDKIDRTLLSATKDMLDAYMCSNLETDKLDIMYKELKNLYSKQKEGECNTDLVESIDCLVDNAKNLRDNVEIKVYQYTS